MDNQSVFSEVLSLLDNLGTIGILIYMLYIERSRADSLMAHILDDWKSNNAKNS